MRKACCRNTLSAPRVLTLLIIAHCGASIALSPIAVVVSHMGVAPPQPVELKVSKVVLVGPCDNSAGKYALAKKKMTMEVGQPCSFTAVACIRNACPEPSKACSRSALLVSPDADADRFLCAAQFLRGMMHLRPRTNTIAAVARIRNALSKATHDFFQTHGFLYLHTPLITTSDCEGAGEMFQVTPCQSFTCTPNRHTLQQ